MLARIGRFPAFVAEFLSHVWPMSKTEVEILEEQRLLYRSDPRRSGS